jgi:O-antigen/teichoic acid export membrane protein
MENKKNESADAGRKWRFIDEPLKERLKKNTVSNILFFILTFPLMFIVTPLILKYTGKEAYGVWAITVTILAFLEFIGLQTPTALSIFIPKFDPKKQFKEINELVNTLFVFYLISAIVVAGIYFGVQETIIKSMFKVDARLLSDARFILTVSVLLYLSNFVLMAYAFIATGFNLFYPANIMHTIIGWLRLGAMAAALIAGYGIKGVAIIQTLSLIVETLVLNIWMKIVYPPLEFNPFLFKFSKLKELLGLSVKLFLTRLAVVVNYNVDKLVLGFFINPVTVAYYQIGASITRYISTVPDMLGNISLIPAASELKSKNQSEKIFSLYSRINKYMFFLGVFLTGAILAFGKEFVMLWLGPGYDTVYTVMIFLSFAYCASLLGTPAMNILNGLEKVNSPMMVAGLTALLNITLSIVLVKYYGLLGALIGTAVSMSAGSIAMYILFYNHTKRQINFFEVLIKPSISVLAAAAVIYFLNPYLTGGWIRFFIKAMLFGAIYLASSFFVVKQFDLYDIDIIKGYIPFIKKKAS